MYSATYIFFDFIRIVIVGATMEANSLRIKHTMYIGLQQDCGVAQWLRRRSLAGALSLICA